MIRTLPLVLLLLAGCLQADTRKGPYQGFAPTPGLDDWTLATPEDVGMSSPALEKAYRLLQPANPDDDDFPTAISMLVARHGKLVGEAYFRSSTDQSHPACVWSTTKSFTSMVFGIARSLGFFDDVNEPLFNIIPEDFDGDVRKRAITIAHALTMQTGLSWDNGGPRENDEELWAGRIDRVVPNVLSQPLEHEPGTSFKYKDGDPMLISGIIQKRTGMSLAAFADVHLMAPLGITNYRWEGYKDGLTYGAFGLFLTPRDLIKTGQMVLDKGSYRGQQVLPADWVQLSTTAQAETPDGLPYGYYWWIAPRGFAARGHGGQYIYIMPALDLVLVFTAEPFAEEVGDADDFDEFARVVKLVADSVVQ